MSRKIRRMDFHFDEWLVGTRQMKPAVRGIYIQVCALIGSHNEPIEDNASEIATWCACTRDYARRVIDQLVAEGKLYRDTAGRLGNNRVEQEISAGTWRVVRAAEAAEERWGQLQKLPVDLKPTPSPRPPVSRKNNGLQPQPAMPTTNQHYDLNHKSLTDAARDPAPDQTAPARAPGKLDPRLEAAALRARAKLLKGEP